MKKKCVIYIIISCIFICTSCGSNNATRSEKNSLNVEPSITRELIIEKTQLKDLFQKWDSSTIEDSEKELIIINFEDYLKANRIQDTNSLKELSENLVIKKLSDIAIITYTETPDFYGESGKQSYTWVVYNDIVTILFSCDSKEIEDIIQDKNNKNIYYLIGRDYLITTCSGVFISRVILDDQNIDFESDVIECQSCDAYHKQEGVLYGNSQLTIKKGNPSGTQINIKGVTDESFLKLYLTANNSFQG